MTNFPYVSIAEIADRLHISRNYIRLEMLPHIRHEKTQQYRVRVDLGELRQWLLENCEFSRQTELVPISGDSTSDANANDAWRKNVPPCNLRKLLPFCFVKPFDFWDKPLLFPDDERFAHAESFYRAMYACGAIKIKLGKRKSIFYAPELTEKNLVSAESFISPYGLPKLEMRHGAMALNVDARLCRAKDDREDDSQATKSFSQKEQSQDDIGVSIGIRGKDSQFVENVKNLIFKAYPRVSVRYYNDGKSAHLTIPKKSLETVNY